MFRKFLGLVDIGIGLLLIVRPEFYFLRFLGLFSLAKGGWSIFSSFALGFFYDVFGLLDLLSGIALLFLINGHSVALFTVLGLVMILKGAFSMV